VSEEAERRRFAKDLRESTINQEERSNSGNDRIVQQNGKLIIKVYKCTLARKFAREILSTSITIIVSCSMRAKRICLLTPAACMHLKKRTLRS